MKTLADLKHRVVKGTKLQLTFHAVEKAQHLVGSIRAVEVVQTADIALATPAAPNGLSWLSWPKAKNLRFDGPDEFTILDDLSLPRMSFRFVTDEPQVAAKPEFYEGQLVRCNGYDGTIMTMCTGQLAGMAEVRVPGGLVCVGLNELRLGRDQKFTYAQPLPEDEARTFEEWVAHYPNTQPLATEDEARAEAREMIQQWITTGYLVLVQTVSPQHT